MDQGPLFDVAAAIADGLPIDWAAFAARTPPSAPDFAPPARLVECVAQVHASLPGVDSFTSSLHKSLAGVRLPGDATAPPEAPVTWGTLTIVEKIGRGTFGDVYRAHDRRLNRPVALKLLRRKDRLESAVIDEGQLMARVRHPNVVTVYGAERIEDRVGLWMQFVDGPTLDQEVRTRGPFTPAEITQAGIQLAQALAAVHRAGLLHRDVKAQNAMRDADGRVLLTDFGTGRELAETSLAAGGHELAGTPLYMAPEVLDGAPASVSSDVYSLGVVLYYLATGSFPVGGRSLRDLRDAHQRNGRQRVRAARPDLPKRLAAVIDRATDPDPAQRPASATDFEAALVASTRSRTRRVAWTAAAAMALAAASVIALRPWRQPAAAVRPPFPTRDFVLVSRFDNRTGDTSFDGGIEYAIARELSRSDIIDVVPADRVLDALQLMKKPLETIVDRTVGREVCLRDGRVKAFVTGRIEKTNRGYVMTAELVDPADGAVVASVTDAAGATAAVFPTIMREATRLKALFRERRARIKSAVPVEPVSTSSLAAFQLYNQARHLFAYLGRVEEAAQINSRALAEDPSFASAWILQAWLLKQMTHHDAEVRDAATRALALAETAPDWERHYIRGVNHWLSGDYTGSMRELEAVVRLRPDFEPASNLLADGYSVLGKPEAASAAFKSIADQLPFDIAANIRAAQNILLLRQNPDEVRPYVNRLDELLTPERSGMPDFYWATFWRRMLPAYEAWTSGDIAGAQAVVDREARDIGQWPEPERGYMHQFIGLFYVTLGRLHDAERHLHDAERLLDTVDPGPWGLMLLADTRDDLPALRSYLLRMPEPGVYQLVKAGLVQQARARLGMNWGGTDEVEENIGRAALALATGSPELVVRLLRTMRIPPRLAAMTQNACGLLATALARLNRRAEAMSELERCAAMPPRFAGNFIASFWMKNELRLADEYRAVGRTADAERIEQQLRRLLVYADADNPLVVQLNAR